MVVFRSLAVSLLAAAVAFAGFVPGADAGHSYELSVWFTWDTAELDVLIQDVDDPLVGAAIQDSIAAWQTGIAQLAPSWLANNLVFRVYDPSTDPVPPAGFEPHDVEIYVVPQGFMAVNGGAVTPIDHCYAFAPLAHEVIFGPNALYRVALHEFGHCLGLDHVFEHGSEYDPPFDPMGGGRDVRACPSNLDIDVMERAFGGLFGQPSGGTVTMSSGSYFQSSC